MAQQLECQLAFIKELQQQMAEMKTANMAAKQLVHHQQEQQQQLIIQQRQQQQEQRKQQRQQQQQQQQQQQSEDDGICPEVIIEEEEGDPFNFVVRKKKAANRNKVSAITQKLTVNPIINVTAYNPKPNMHSVNGNHNCNNIIKIIKYRNTTIKININKEKVEDNIDLN
ncbi:serum response factor homolog A-like [Hermetia illucens]|uniref:serum response factor homolog A-like n=1 Tax=Hermetia illucens TaxID=343691 RepID=UPI0018CC1741|nr:serum response factor homolog A-like [Hermetia illucens]